MHDRGRFNCNNTDTDFKQRIGRLSKNLDIKGEQLLFDYRHKRATLRSSNPKNQLTGYPNDSAHKSTTIRGFRPRATSWSSAETDRRIHQMFMEDFSRNR